MGSQEQITQVLVASATTQHLLPVQQEYAGDVVGLVLYEDLTAGLKELNKRHGTTPYMTLLAGWAVLQ